MPISCGKLNSGRPLGCKTVGGISEVYLTEKENISGYTVNASSVITGFTMSTNKFYKFDIVKETSNYTDNLANSTTNQSTQYVQSLVLQLFKGDTSTRNIIKTLASNLLCALIKRNDGSYVVLGLTQGLELTTSNYGTGTAIADKNGYELTFTSNETEPAFEVSSTLISTITSA